MTENALLTRVQGLLRDTTTYAVVMRRDHGGRDTGDVLVQCPGLQRSPTQRHDHLDAARAYLKRHGVVVRSQTGEFRGRTRLVALLVPRQENLAAAYGLAATAEG